MATKSLENQIQSYLPLLGTDEKQSVLSVIKSFLKLKEKSASFDIEAYNRELDEADREIEAGDFLTHEEAVKISQSW